MLRAGIEQGSRYLTAHSLRHTYNTRMRKVLPEAFLQYMMGHKDRKMTDHYDHATPEDRLRELAPALESINGIWN